MSDPKPFIHDESIRAALQRHMEDNELTHAQQAAKLGLSSPTRLTKYLTLNRPDRAPEPDAGKVEAAARAFLRHMMRGAKLRESLFENSVSKDVVAVLKQIRRTGDVALIHSKAGLGKTCGAVLYCRDEPNTLFITVKPYACGSWNVEQMIFEEFIESSDEAWPGNQRRALWLEKRLRGTERLLIVDDAELMHISGFKFVFALHDATGIPVAFIGNPEVLKTLRANDHSGKLISRIGVMHEARMKDDARDTAERLIAQFAPDSGRDLMDAVTDVVSSAGHCRRARKRLVLAASIHEGMSAGKRDWSAAFEMAETKLVKLTRQGGAS